MKLRRVWALAKKEYLTCINSPIAYIFIGVYILFSNWFFFSDFFVRNEADTRNFFTTSAWLLILIIPALTMRLWAEEKKSGTIEQLLTLPINEAEVVMGKFTGAFLFFLTTLIFTLNIPLTTKFYGSLDWGVVAVNYLSLLLLGGAFIAIGVCISNLTSNQIAAFMVSLIVCALIFLLGTPLVTNSLPASIKNIAVLLGGGAHFENSLRGVLDSRNLAYFLSLIAVFLTFNTLQLRKRSGGVAAKITDTLTVQTVLIVGIALVFNYLMNLSPLRLDLSKDRVNSLSPETKQILTELKDIVSIKTYFSANLPPRYVSVKQRTLDTLSDFQNETAGTLKISHVNPQNAADYEKETQSLGIPLLQFNDVEKDRFQVSNGYLGILLTFGDKKEVIPVVEDTNNLEYELISAINRLVREKDPAVAFTESSPTNPQEDRFGLIKQLLEKQFSIREVDLAKPETLQENLNALVFTTSEQKLTPEALLTLDQLIAKGVGVILLNDGVKVDTNLKATPSLSDLSSILSRLGLTQNQDLVLDRSNDFATFNTGYSNIIIPYAFWVKVTGENLGQSVIVNKLDSVTLPWASSFSYKENSAITPLLWSSKINLVQKNNFDLNPQQAGPKEETERRLLSALFVGKYDSGVDKSKLPTGFEKVELSSSNEKARVIVVGDSDFLDNGMLQRFQGNALFFLNAVDYLSQDERLIGIRAKSNTLHTLKVNPEDVNGTVVKAANIFSPLVVMVILGFSLYKIRKNKRYELT